MDRQHHRLRRGVRHRSSSGRAGPSFGYSDTWQLVINTGTTIVTFLMVFLIQRSQNKDSLAVQLKLNELVAAMEGASNRLIDVEDLSRRGTARPAQVLLRGWRRWRRRTKSSATSHSIEEADLRHAAKASDGPASGDLTLRSHTFSKKHTRAEDRGELWVALSVISCEVFKELTLGKLVQQARDGEPELVGPFVAAIEDEPVHM